MCNFSAQHLTPLLRIAVSAATVPAEWPYPKNTGQIAGCAQSDRPKSRVRVTRGNIGKRQCFLGFSGRIFAWSIEPRIGYRLAPHNNFAENDHREPESIMVQFIVFICAHTRYFAE